MSQRKVHFNANGVEREYKDRYYPYKVIKPHEKGSCCNPTDSYYNDVTNDPDAVTCKTCQAIMRSFPIKPEYSGDVKGKVVSPKAKLLAAIVDSLKENKIEGFTFKTLRGKRLYVEDSLDFGDAIPFDLKFKGFTVHITLEEHNFGFTEL